jgi:hypothetical protein
MKDMFEEGKKLPLPTADELWEMAGRLAQMKRQTENGKGREYLKDGEWAGLEAFGEDMGEWAQAAMNVASLAKSFQKDVRAAAQSSVESGKEYFIKGMSPKYLNGVRVQVVEVRDGYAYSELLDETGHKDTKGSRIGISFTCLVPAF